jgi:peroxiredoxin
MKKVGIILGILIIISSCNQKNKFHIEGNLTDLNDTTVYLNHMGVNSIETIDSTKTGNNGEFKISGETEYPRFYQLAISDNNFLTLLIKPGEDVNIQTSSDQLINYTVEGSPGSKKVQLLDSRLRNTKKRLDSLTREYKKAEALKASEERLEEINQEYRDILNRQRDSSIAFIVENLGSLASIMALYQKVNPETFVLYKNADLQYIKIVSDSLKEKYPQSGQVKALLANKEDLMKKYKNLSISQTLQRDPDKISYSIPEIKLPNIQGDTVSLNSLDEKMILLSFWSSQNKESVQRNLELKKLYNRYHKKGFEIYQVSLDQDEEAWKNAVKFDQLPWINVGSQTGMNAYAARLYNVKQLPADFLINKKREIVARNPEIYELRRKLSIALD